MRIANERIATDEHDQIDGGSRDAAMPGLQSFFISVSAEETNAVIASVAVH
jgi:hypothetical protein